MAKRSEEKVETDRRATIHHLQSTIHNQLQKPLTTLDPDIAGMYRFSFRIRHNNCDETVLSGMFPKQHIAVTSIQSHHQKEKQYFYYIRGFPREFDSLIREMKKLKGYTHVEEVERTKDSLQLLVVLHQSTYVQTAIQNNHGFLIDMHTVHGGWEYWHVGVVDKKHIIPMMRTLKTMGDLKTLTITKTEFAPALLSPQQKNIFEHAYAQGYYQTPKMTTVAKIAKALHLSTATVGEHLSKAENKIIISVAKRL